MLRDRFIRLFTIAHLPISMGTLPSKMEPKTSVLVATLLLELIISSRNASIDIGAGPAGSKRKYLDYKIKLDELDIKITPDTFKLFQCSPMYSTNASWMA